MISYIVYEISTGEIKVFGITKQENYNLLGGDGLEVIEGIGLPQTHWVNDGVLQEYTVDQKLKKEVQLNPFCVWSNQIFDWVDTRTSDEIYQSTANSVRTQRNILLQSSDWTDTFSAPDRLGQNVYQNWQTYRQALRDITTQSGYPFSVIWPTPPA
jgi:hypothetical protein